MAVVTRPRVLVADDHGPTRAAICRVLEDADLPVCATAHDAEGAVEGARRTQPDVALLDVRMPGDGIHAARVIREERPETAIVMLTVSDQDEDLFAALSAGAAGYLLKGQDPATIPDALRMIVAGEAVLPGGLVKRIVHEYRARDARQSVRSRIPRGARLTPREWEVLELLNEGLGTAEIGRRLFVADVTVRTHVTAIIRKLRVKDRAGALQLIRGETS